MVGVGSLTFGESRNDESDNDWYRIGGSFPGLRDLTIYHDAHAKHHRTWRTPPSLVAKCEGLQMLEMNPHISTFFLDKATLWDTPVPSLKVLRVVRLYVQRADIDSFARYLSKLSPRVQAFAVDDFYDPAPMDVSTPPGWTREPSIHRLFEERAKDFFIRKFFEHQADGLPAEMI
ncbi:hypothetical protein FRB98_007013 [Tulasnella sp. 332]|nr:hypothetical protein FRB98_007013 [Tulasnella sp. 332]